MRDQPELDPGDPNFPSGEWIGFYKESGSNHRQEMRLTFSSGSMSGAGADAIGPFFIRGRYCANSREVWWTKSYPGSHDVHYKGYREVKGIWGLWEIPPGARDGFHIWPRAHGEGPSARTAAEKTEPVTVGPSSLA
ncbi:MAG: hypothetical protein AAF628_35620 [Planctomycetota bacterium]